LFTAAEFLRLAFSLHSESQAKTKLLGDPFDMATKQPSVYRFRKGLLLVLPETMLVSVGETIGLPLIRNRGSLPACH